jgi:pilus assembly protein CpaC
MTTENKHTDVRFARTKTRRAGALLTAAGAVIALLIGGTAAGADSTAEPTVATSQPATSANSYITDGLNDGAGIKLLTGKSITLTTKTPYKRMQVTNPDVADVNAIGPSSILLTAKKAGDTQLILWDDQDRAQVVNVNVDVDLESVKRQLKASFPDLKIDAQALADSVALRGQVPSAQVAEQAVEMTSSFAKVHNFLEISGGQQVILQVQIAEVSKSVERDLGVNFGGTDGVTIFGNNAGGFNPFGLAGGPPPMLQIPGGGSLGQMFLRGEAGNTAFAIFIKALRENNLMRTLAEPNVIAINGQEASFLAGGSIPVPVSQGGTGGSAAISVTYEPYGVQLHFTPQMLGNGKIRLKVAPDVSALDYGNAVTIPGSGPIPALTEQKVDTTVELADGQSFALAGLLNNTTNATVDAIPLLGDIPILGELFRSTKFQRSETELVIIVTPRLVEPLNPDQVPALPGQYWRNPTGPELYLGMDMGGPKVQPGVHSADKNGSAMSGPPPQFHGSYGFIPAGAGMAAPVQ